MRIGEEYVITVYARNTEGRSPSSAQENIVHALVPTQPRDVQTSNDGANLAISWQRSSDNGDSVTEYKVYIRKSDGNYGDALSSAFCDGKSAANLAENSELRRCSFKLLEL